MRVVGSESWITDTPVEVAIKYTDMCHKQGVRSEEQLGRSKIDLSNYCCDEIYDKCVQPHLLDLVLKLIKSLS